MAVKIPAHVENALQTIAGFYDNPDRVRLILKTRLRADERRMPKKVRKDADGDVNIGLADWRINFDNNSSFTLEEFLDMQSRGHERRCHHGTPHDIGILINEVCTTEPVPHLHDEVIRVGQLLTLDDYERPWRHREDIPMSLKEEEELKLGHED